MRSYNSLEEMFADMAKNEAAASKAAETHHLKVKDLHHGDHFIRFYEPGLKIYGEVVERMDGSEEAEAIAEEIKDSREAGYVFAKCYSEVCVGGELGDTHITRIDRKISQQTFDRAKANGWRHVDFTN